MMMQKSCWDPIPGFGSWCEARSAYCTNLFMAIHSFQPKFPIHSENFASCSLKKSSKSKQQLGMSCWYVTRHSEFSLDQSKISKWRRHLIWERDIHGQSAHKKEKPPQWGCLELLSSDSELQRYIAFKKNQMDIKHGKDHIMISII